MAKYSIFFFNQIKRQQLNDRLQNQGQLSMKILTNNVKEKAWFQIFFKFALHYIVNVYLSCLQIKLKLIQYSYTEHMNKGDNPN